MSFDALPPRRQKIAIVGSGISGLASAYLLGGDHDVTIYEAEPRLGGHARTVMAGLNGDQPVDTGFIVFNYVNYPHLTAMFDALDVPVIKSDMTFGASIDGGRIEYGLKDLNAVFGQRRNLARPAFLKFIRDILRFNENAEAAVQDETTTIAELVQQLGLGAWFIDYYLMPICGAIWSTPPERIGAYPAASLLRFFRNHALLSTSGQHQWWTVKGGSIEYVRRLEARLRKIGVNIRTSAPVQSVERSDAGVIVRAKGGPAEVFDQIILASHSDQSLRLLANPSDAERRALRAIEYQPNRVVLHRDPSTMPKRKACWSSWVYKSDLSGDARKLGVTYWMNRLQAIPESDPLFVSLNPSGTIPDEMIYDEVMFDHPVFTGAALDAQRRLTTMQGVNRTWFAGAYMRNGFHEDGFHSAVEVAKAMASSIAPSLAAE